MAHITSWIPTEPGAESAAGMAREPHGTQRRKGCRKHDRIGRRTREEKKPKNQFRKIWNKIETAPNERFHDADRAVSQLRNNVDIISTKF